MTNLTQFTSKQNLKLLWDVLLDELHINTTNTKLIANIRTVFESNINPFLSRANTKSSIMDLNKQFLSQVVLAVNRLFPQLKQDQNIKRITISDEEISDSQSLQPYKIEDIHSLRQNNFEKEVERKKMELENYMTPQKPKDLDFSDTNIDGKITAMDSLIAEKMAQRNLEIETLQNSNYNITSIDPEKWLRPKETSVKNEKNIPINTVTETHYKSETSKLKHISFDNNNNITLSILEPEKKSQTPMKKVTWNEIETHNEPIANIFNKLKKQPILESNLNDNVNKDNQYIEQQSMTLPYIKQEEIIRNQATVPTPNNEPVIPKTEIIKQLNEMNKKIDSLYEVVFKLTKMIENNKEENNQENNEENI